MTLVIYDFRRVSTLPNESSSFILDALTRVDARKRALCECDNGSPFAFIRRLRAYTRVDARRRASTRVYVRRRASTRAVRVHLKSVFKQRLKTELLRRSFGASR